MDCWKDNETRIESTEKLCPFYKIVCSFKNLQWSPKLITYPCTTYMCLMAHSSANWKPIHTNKVPGRNIYTWCWPFVLRAGKISSCLQKAEGMVKVRKIHYKFGIFPCPARRSIHDDKQMSGLLALVPRLITSCQTSVTDQNRDSYNHL